MAIATLAGCAGASHEKAAPFAATGPGMVAPLDTGAYPNLNIPPPQAAPQFSGAETSAKLSELASERTATQTSGGAPPDPGDAAKLDKLARNHAKNTLRAIGATCDPARDSKCK